MVADPRGSQHVVLGHRIADPDRGPWRPARAAVRRAGGARRSAGAAVRTGRAAGRASPRRRSPRAWPRSSPATPGAWASTIRAATASKAAYPLAAVRPDRRGPGRAASAPARPVRRPPGPAARPRASPRPSGSASSPGGRASARSLAARPGARARPPRTSGGSPVGIWSLPSSRARSIACLQGNRRLGQVQVDAAGSSSARRPDTGWRPLPWQRPQTPRHRRIGRCRAPIGASPGASRRPAPASADRARGLSTMPDGSQDRACAVSVVATGRSVSSTLCRSYAGSRKPRMASIMVAAATEAATSCIRRMPGAAQRADRGRGDRRGEPLAAWPDRSPRRRSPCWTPRRASAARGRRSRSAVG